MNTRIVSIEQKLFGLLRESLWGKPFDEVITPEEAAGMIAIARKQTVTGLIIDVLIKKGVRMERQTLFEAMALLKHIRQQSQEMNRHVVKFAQMMRETDVDYIIVKGQTLAALYPDPLLRMPGDIDFLVRDYNKAANVLHDRWNIDLPQSLCEKEFAFRYGNALYELHTYLINFGLHRHLRYWENVLAKSSPVYIVIDGKQVRIIEPTLYTVYIFVHLFFHFVREGIGLRHLCDWAIMMHHYKDEIDRDFLVEVLNNLGLLKAFRTFGSIIVDYLGMENFPLLISQNDRQMQSRIIHDIMYGGNFGKDRRKVKGIGFSRKVETLWLTFSNSFRYLSLAPSELLMLTYRRIVVNLKIAIYSVRQTAGKNLS